MRRNVFTSYIICNRLNLKTFFEPIIDFIEIGKLGPPRTVYDNFISYSSNRNTQILVETDMCNRNFLILWFKNPLGYEKRKIRKLFFVVICQNIKSAHLSLDVYRYRPLESSIYLFFFMVFLFIWNTALLVFSLW